MGSSLKLSSNSITAVPVTSRLPEAQKMGATSEKSVLSDILGGAGRITKELTDGHFDAGVYGQKVGESDADYKARLLASLGSALNAGQDKAKDNVTSSGDWQTDLKNGVISNELKNIAWKALLFGGGTILGIWALVKFVFKRKKKGGR